MSINYKIHLLWDNKKLLLLLKHHLQNKLRIFLEPTLTLVERQLSSGLNLFHLFNYFSFDHLLFIIYYSIIQLFSFTIIWQLPSLFHLLHLFNNRIFLMKRYLSSKSISPYFLSTLLLIWLKPWWQNIARSLRWNQVPTDWKKIVCTVH